MISYLYKNFMFIFYKFKDFKYFFTIDYFLRKLLYYFYYLTIIIFFNFAKFLLPFTRLRYCSSKLLPQVLDLKRVRLYQLALFCEVNF